MEHGITTVQSLQRRSPWGHIRCVQDDAIPPERVLPLVAIICIGPHFLPGVMEGIVRNGVYANKRGYDIAIEVIHDVCIHPNEGVNMMRNWACMSAMDKGADYLFMVDNDYLLDDPTTLYTLLEARQHVIIPWVDQSEINPSENPEHMRVERLGYPMVYPDQGVVPLRWHSINCVLFDMLVFKLIGTQLFSGSLITNHEDYIYLQLRNYGIHLWQHTNAKVKVLKPSTKVWAEHGEKNPNPSTPENIAKMQGIIDGIHEMWNQVVAEMKDA